MFVYDLRGVEERQSNSRSEGARTEEWRQNCRFDNDAKYKSKYANSRLWISIKTHQLLTYTQKFITIIEFIITHINCLLPASTSESFLCFMWLSSQLNPHAPRNKRNKFSQQTWFWISTHALIKMLNSNDNYFRFPYMMTMNPPSPHPRICTR